MLIRNALNKSPQIVELRVKVIFCGKIFTDRTCQSLECNRIKNFRLLRKNEQMFIEFRRKIFEVIKDSFESFGAKNFSDKRSKLKKSNYPSGTATSKRYLLNL